MRAARRVEPGGRPGVFCTCALARRGGSDRSKDAGVVCRYYLLTNVITATIAFEGCMNMPRW